MKSNRFIILLLTIVLLISGCGQSMSQDNGALSDKQQISVETTDTSEKSSDSLSAPDIDNIPEYSGTPYAVLNDNIPYFSSDDFTTQSYEKYVELDELGRCGVAVANIGTDLMPTDPRESISHVKPTGWTSGKDPAQWNRCHLIGFQLAGENDNEKNLITGTRYMNVDGMLPFENLIADYVKETENHVLYRVTPIFKESDLVAQGVVMEAYSIEDNGDGICFNVFCYNVQPNVVIDYATGKNWYEEEVTTDAVDTQETEYVLNTSSKKIHRPTCSAIESMNPNKKKVYTGDISELLENGYTRCKTCNP